MEDQMKQEYHDWVALLNKTDNRDLLRDPYSIWTEAWHVAMMVGKKIPVQDGEKPLCQ
jgi:hypothetical protein